MSIGFALNIIGDDTSQGVQFEAWLEINSFPGQGTRLRIEVPWQPEV